MCYAPEQGHFLALVTQSSKRIVSAPVSNVSGEPPQFGLQKGSLAAALLALAGLRPVVSGTFKSGVWE
jgi:hypothetical protein